MKYQNIEPGDKLKSGDVEISCYKCTSMVLYGNDIAICYFANDESITIHNFKIKEKANDKWTCVRKALS